MNVLGLQLRRVGEILMTTPALRALKLRFPQAQLTFVCERPFSPVLRANEHVDELLPYDADAGLKERLRLLATLRERRFDLALDFEGSTLSALLTGGSGAARRIGYRSWGRDRAYTDRVDLGAARGAYLAGEKLALLGPLGVDVRTPNLRPVLAVEARARDWAQRTLDSAGIGTGQFLLTVAPSARRAECGWPSERYARLLDALAVSHVFETIVLPGPGETQTAETLARLTSVPLLQLSRVPLLAQIAALLDRADLHLGNENAAQHMAASLGTATLAFYTPGERRRWVMPGDPLQAGMEPGGPAATPAPPAPTGAGERSTPRRVAPPITRIGVEEAYAALVGLEAYLPRLRAARRSAPALAPTTPAVLPTTAPEDSPVSSAPDHVRRRAPHGTATRTRSP